MRVTMAILNGTIMRVYDTWEGAVAGEQSVYKEGEDGLWWGLPDSDLGRWHRVQHCWSHNDRDFQLKLVEMTVENHP